MKLSPIPSLVILIGIICILNQEKVYLYQKYKMSLTLVILSPTVVPNIKIPLFLVLFIQQETSKWNFQGNNIQKY